MGADVSGIDASKRSIDYAIQSVPKENLPIRYVNGDCLEYTFAERYDLTTMIFCDYCCSFVVFCAEKGAYVSSG